MELQKLDGEEADCDESATTEVKDPSKARKQLSKGRAIVTAIIMLLCYTFLNAASSMIAPFYPVEVSLISWEWLPKYRTREYKKANIMGQIYSVMGRDLPTLGRDRLMAQRDNVIGSTHFYYRCT